MTDLEPRRRRAWPYAASVLLLLALAAPWAVSRVSPRPPDDPRELLRRAGAPAVVGSTAATGKAIEVRGTTAAGAPARALLQEVREPSGRAGYGLHLPGDFKEGETATLSLPGGGNVVVGRPPGGAVIRGPQE